ncbi:hypothetical protein QQF64_022386 [Cirrhinus molitorella]|uniref:Uncharacterized protein n=1 Tax=Cirrhinus molitorella TaxID=172907 RepID=A0ABR3L885_9TELE
MRGNLSSGRAGLKRTADAIRLEEDKALWFSEPMGGGGGLGLSHAFLRSCSERNLPDCCLKLQGPIATTHCRETSGDLGYDVISSLLKAVSSLIVIRFRFWTAGWI